MLLTFSLLLCLVASRGLGEEVFGRVSESVVLECHTNAEDCGEIHSIKWYRGMDRVYVYSPFTDFRNAEGILVDRSNVIDSGVSTDLQIDNLMASDDGTYRCEITYLDVSTACASVYSHKLTTTALPKSVVLSVGEEQLLTVEQPELGIETGVAGPFKIGDEVEFTCEAIEFKPEVRITWKAGEEDFGEGIEELEDLGDGASSMKSSFKLPMERQHLGQSVVCSVIFEEETVSELSVELDLEVAPAGHSLVVVDMMAGEESMLECRVSGARPTAVPRWIGLEHLETTELLEETEEEDGTISVVNTVTFTPTSAEDNQQISCIVEHPALEEDMEETSLLNVKYPPEVRLESDNENNNTVLEGDPVTLSCAYSANPSNGTKLVWYFNEEVFDDPTSVATVEDEEGNEIDVLMLDPANRTNSGDYTCTVENELGIGSSNKLYLDVLYAPTVELSMDSEEALVEGDARNVTLTCTMVDGNPAELTYVLWFQNEDSLGPDLDDCDDRSCYLTVEGDRSDAGDYTCRGQSDAGIGDESNIAALQVYYTPSEGMIEADGYDAVKFGNTSMDCVLEDLGYPEVEYYMWKRDGELIARDRESVLVLEDLGAGSVGNITCSGVNTAGTNFGEEFFLDVSAPPVFLSTPPDHVEMTEDYEWVNLTCQVECAPLCTVEWLRNFQRIVGGQSLDSIVANSEDESNLFSDYEVMTSAMEVESVDEASQDDLELFVGEEMISEDEDSPFFITVEHLPAVPSDNQFASVVSTLSIQLGNVSKEVLDAFQFSNFTCRVASNGFGEEISTTSMLTIHHEPMDMEVSVDDLTLVEDAELDPILCTVEAVPEPQIVWKKDGEMVADSGVLEFENPISRDNSGEYTCEASNYRGSTSKSFNLNVEYVPSCYVTKEHRDDLVILKCIADGYPQDFLFWWAHENMTVEGQVEEETSVLSLRNVNDSMLYEYSCFVNNSIGQSQPCLLQEEGGFLYLATEEPWLLAIVILAIILAIIIIAAIVWYICCRNKAGKGGSGGPSKGKHTDDQPHPDNSFYDNLPFHGLKNPPKQVLTAVDDNMVYADVDAQETYSYGPLTYKTASLQRAAKLKKLEESKL